MSEHKLDSVPDRIRHARLIAGLSPQEMRVALREHGMQYSQGGWHRVENIEPTNPNLQLIQTIGKITGVSPGWILFGQGEAMIDDASTAIRRRIIDTIEMMGGTLRMNKRQATSFEKLISSLREDT